MKLYKFKKKKNLKEKKKMKTTKLKFINIRIIKNIYKLKSNKI
jgi:hypothetical protein